MFTIYIWYRGDSNYIPIAVSEEPHSYLVYITDILDNSYQVLRYKVSYEGSFVGPKDYIRKKWIIE